MYNGGELSLVEYGQNSILGSARTEHMSPYLISVCINPARGSQPAEKKMAYLVDKQTAKVSDLIAGVVLATVSHTYKIDWLVSCLLCILMQNAGPSLISGFGWMTCAVRAATTYLTCLTYSHALH